MHAKSLQSCPTLCGPMYCSLPGSCVHGILQERILDWVTISFSRASSWPRDRTPVSLHLLHWQADSLPSESLGKPRCYTVVVVELLSHVWLFSTPWTATSQASLSCYLPEFAQTQARGVCDTRQPPRPLSPLSPSLCCINKWQQLLLILQVSAQGLSLLCIWSPQVSPFHIPTASGAAFSLSTYHTSWWPSRLHNTNLIHQELRRSFVTGLPIWL